METRGSEKDLLHVHVKEIKSGLGRSFENESQLTIIDLHVQKDLFHSVGKTKAKSNFVYIFFPPQIIQERIRKGG